MSNSFYFKSGSSASCVIIGTLKADARFIEARNLTAMTVVTREVYVRKDGETGEVAREVALYVEGMFQAQAGDVVMATGKLTLAEAKGGNAKYPTLFEKVEIEHLENLGAVEGVEGLNQAVIIGRVGKIRKIDTKTGKHGVIVSVAVKRSAGNDEMTDWHEMSFWDKRAERAEQYLGTGDLIKVDGALALRPQQVGEKKMNILGFQPSDFSILNRKQNGNSRPAATKAPAKTAAPEKDAFADDPMF